MKSHFFRVSCIAGLGTAACAAQSGAGSDSDLAKASLRDATGRAVAAVTFQKTDGLTVRVEATGLPPGVHGVHIHAVGLCDPPSFDSAGPHWNPTDRRHGNLNPNGPHMGDLPNLSAGSDGNGAIEFNIPNATLRSGEHPLLDDDGAALVVHAAADDYRTDPSGTSGARIACGVVE